MELNIYADYQILSQQAAEEILTTVKNNPAAVLCLATGHTPRLAYDILVKKALDERIDFSSSAFIGLDEWIGIPAQNEGSCHFYLENRLFRPLNITRSQIYLFDSMSTDFEAECHKADQAIESKGGIDLMLVGIGVNGHIGFNEPGVSPGLNAHVISLEEITQSVGQKYFVDATPIKQGITLGLNQVLQSKKLIMIANGNKKAAVMQKALEGAISNEVPASILRTHAHARTMIDREAAGLLNLQTLSPEVS